MLIVFSALPIHLVDKAPGFLAGQIFLLHFPLDPLFLGSADKHGKNNLICIPQHKIGTAANKDATFTFCDPADLVALQLEKHL